MNIYLTPGIKKRKNSKRVKQIHQTVSKIYAFRNFKTLKSSKLLNICKIHSTRESKECFQY